LGVRGPKSKIEEHFVGGGGTWRTDGQKIVRFDRETKKKNQCEVCDRQTDAQTDSQRQKIIDS